MTVFLVGAGPGDPGLVTLRAQELLRRADVVVHDRLVDVSVLAMSGPGAELIDVGKFRGGQSLSQEEINELLVTRGGEEAAALEAAGVAYEVVPGVSSFSAVPEAAGVPLTMRGLSSSVLLITGHDPSTLGAQLSSAAALSADTVVVLMGGETRSTLADRLIEAGKPADTPVLVVEAGTTPEQRTRRTTLGELSSLEVTSPVTLVVGAVAALGFSSYERRPLFGWRVVVTRAEAQAGQFAQALMSLGAVAILLPTIEILPPTDAGAALDAAVGQIATFDWVVLSSANAVDAFFGELPDARVLAGVKIAVIGDRTAAAVRSHGVIADLVPERFSAEGLAEVFPDAPRPSSKVLIPRAALAREVLPEALRARGWTVETPTAYETVHPELTREQRRALVGAHVVTFASSSAVTGLLETVAIDELPPVIASIGPATTATLARLGIAVAIEAPQHTMVSLLDELVAYATGHPTPG